MFRFLLSLLISISIISSMFFSSYAVVYGQARGNSAGENADSFKILQPDGGGFIVKTGPGSSSEGNVGRILKNVVGIFYAIGGTGVVIYVLWGAVEWIFSGGDKEKVANARKKMTHALIGLVLLALSFVIINLVGRVVGFNPLGCLQIPGLNEINNPVVGQEC